MTDLRPVPRSMRCTGCARWIHPKTWNEPADLALVDPVAQVILCESCAQRAGEKIAEAAERRGR